MQPGVLLATDMIEDVFGAKRSVKPAGSGTIYPREFLISQHSIWGDGGGGGGVQRGRGMKITQNKLGMICSTAMMLGFGRF